MTKVLVVCLLPALLATAALAIGSRTDLNSTCYPQGIVLQLKPVINIYTATGACELQRHDNPLRYSCANFTPAKYCTMLYKTA